MLEKMKTGEQKETSGIKKVKKTVTRTIAALAVAGLTIGDAGTALAGKREKPEAQVTKPIEQEAGVNYGKNTREALEKKYGVKIIEGSLPHAMYMQQNRKEMTEEAFEAGWEEAVGQIIIPGKEQYEKINNLSAPMGQYARLIGKASGLMFAMKYEGSQSALERYKIFYKKLTDKIVNDLSLSAKESNMNAEAYLKNNNNDKIKKVIRYVFAEEAPPMSGEKVGDWIARAVEKILESAGVNKPPESPKPPSR